MKKKKQDWNNIILDSIADGIFTIDCNQNITYFNRAAEKITGVKREEAQGKNVLRFSGQMLLNASQSAF